MRGTLKPGPVIAARACVLAVLLPACTEGDKPAPPILLNFHAIEEGRAYRSPQLSGEALAWVVDRYGIRTVVNLRGANPDQKWYRDEAAVCRDKGVALVDLAFNSQQLPAPELLAQLIETLAQAERPILIHCQGGADRTGAAAALYRMTVLKQSREQAMAELSVDYWHSRAKAPCMDRLIEIFEPAEGWLERYATTYQQISCRPGTAPVDAAGQER